MGSPKITVETRLLRGWLFLCGIFRLYSVYLGYFDVETIRRGLFSNAGHSVSDLYGRTFSTWTALSCILCFATAYKIENTALILVTFGSFCLVLFHFGLEIFFFRTIGMTQSIAPSVIAVYLEKVRKRVFYAPDPF
ncbi:putative Ergosterol biosynthetic protein 28 [Cardiosporidium cionae]|uniref:Ergosterol biosynthetic protein 28 n=1 Tax=Cardiosporidium cionae TaxID=476202 RepID=A0ABQ7JDS4_9APIC|nr:putative Ergosterol biosynthetic protein 28 [Cardiosporidium cionae]|eukprot:KAF8822155.1 putative Ergosterol biosynthetic protein 28 [Cardiosporidium cionae]